MVETGTDLDEVGLFMLILGVKKGLTEINWEEGEA